MRISDWSSDVCSSDLPEACRPPPHRGARQGGLGRKLVGPGPRSGAVDPLPGRLVHLRTGQAGQLAKPLLVVGGKAAQVAEPVVESSLSDADALVEEQRAASRVEAKDRKSTRLNSSH